MKTIEFPLVGDDRVDDVSPDDQLGTRLMAVASDLRWTPGYFPTYAVVRNPITQGYVLLERAGRWDDVVTYTGGGITLDVIND